MRKYILALGLALMLVVPAAAEFAVETVDTGGTGEMTDIDLDPDGAPVICYYDATLDALKLVAWSEGGWSFTVVDDAGSRGQDCSVHVDADGDPHLVYLDFVEYDLRYAYREDDVWNLSSPVAQGYIGMGARIAAAPDGEIRMAYLDGTELKVGYVWLTPSGPSQYNIGGFRNLGGKATSLVVETASRAYMATFNDVAGSLLIYRGHGLVWESYLVDGAATPWRFGWDNAMAQDDAGELHVAYYDQTNGELHYAWGPWGAMDNEMLDESDWCGHPLDLAVEGHGRPHVCYYSETVQELRYGYRVSDEEGWLLYSIDSGEGVGRDCSIAVADDGIVTIAYHDALAGSLKVAVGSEAPPVVDDDDDDDDDNDDDNDDNDDNDDDDDNDDNDNDNNDDNNDDDNDDNDVYDIDDDDDSDDDDDNDSNEDKCGC